MNFDTVDNVTVSPSLSPTVVLRLVRGPGIYGIVNVPFKATTLASNAPVSDLTPSSGIVTFLDRQVKIITSLNVAGSFSLLY